MQPLRRLTVAVTAAALAAVMTVPASAQTAGDTYAAEAESTALELSLFGQALSVGNAAAQNSSPSNAAAQGSGALALTESFGATSASVDGPNQDDGSPEFTCSELTLPAEVPFLSASAACSASQAGSGGADTASNATGQALFLELSGDAALAPLADALAELPLNQVTDPLCDGLGDLLGAVLPVPCSLVVDELGQLLQDAITGNDVALLTIEAGDTSSTTTSDATTVTASTVATGLTITVLDGGLLGGPLLTIEAGETTTEVVRDRATGETTASETAVPARITLSPALALLLGLPSDPIEVPGGERIDLPLPAPLESSLTLAAGQVVEIDGGARAESAVVDLELFSGLEGGVSLRLSEGYSQVIGDVAEAPAPPPAEEPPPAEAPPAPDPAAPAPPRTTLPRTGVEERSLNGLALVLVLSALGVGAVVVRSTRRGQSTQV